MTTTDAYQPFENFENFDEEDVYKRYRAALLNPDTHNIIIDFDNATSFSASDVDIATIRKITKNEVRRAILQPFFSHEPCAYRSKITNSLIHNCSGQVNQERGGCTLPT
jgi:hypothetical protein